MYLSPLFFIHSITSAILFEGKNQQKNLRRQSRKIAKRKTIVLEEFSYDARCWLQRGLATPILRKRSECIELTCNPNSMVISLSEDLIPKKSEGFHAWQSKKETYLYAECRPYLYENRWHLNTDFANCGIKMSQILEEGETLIQFMFDVQSFIKDAFGVDIPSRISAKCRFNSEVALDDVIASNAEKLTGNSVTKYGSMRSNFAIQTFEESSFQNLMDDDTTIHIGKEIFLQVEWLPAQRIGQLHFAIDSCGVTFQGHEIMMPLVVDNCYSRLFDARILSNHLEKKKARFSYRLFSIVNSRRNSATMHCKLKLCNKKDLSCLTSLQNKDCPETEPFDFTIDGN